MPLILSGSAGLSGNVGNVTKDMLPAGSVLQLQSAYLQSGTSMTTTTWTPVGLDITITPTYSTSKIAVRMSSACAYYVGVSVVSLKFSRIVGGTVISDSPLAGTAQNHTMGLYNAAGSGNNNGTPITVEWVDSPNTTQPVTYRVFMKGNGAGQIKFGTGAEGNSTGYDVVSTITAIEIKG